MILEVVGSIALIFSPVVVVAGVMGFIEWSRKYPIW